LISKEQAEVSDTFTRGAVDVERAAELYNHPYEPDLAWSLSNLSVRLAAVGRREEGLAAIQESVEVRRRLAQGESGRLRA
jgi:hypothetical protein